LNSIFQIVFQAEKSKIFKEFTRCHNEFTQGIEGSGLGLSILSKLVKLYEGAISVESEFGKGSKFIIILKKI
jgi:signal transduction histidine kinase